MATIGRNRAVVDMPHLAMSGFVAWLAWAGLHILKLVGYRNRLLVALQWLLAYLTFHRGARLITGAERAENGRVPPLDGAISELETISVGGGTDSASAPSAMASSVARASA
jgi:hypothetical protein